MVRTKNIPIQKKILFSMLILTLLPIVLITAVAMTITYRTMCSQLVYDHRMSSGWLQRSMNVLTADTLDQFYEFEVNRDIKNDIMRWCIQGEALNYEAQWKIITAMNTVMNINSNVKRIELFNLAGDQVLTTERSGAQLSNTGNQLEVWNQRDPGLQTNLMYCKGEDELLVYHLIFNFDNKMPAALLAFHLKPLYIREILDEIKTVDAETLIVLNDENNVLEANYGSQWHITDDQVEEIRRELAESERKEVQSDGHFWFYRTISGGKLQLLTAVPNQTIVNAMFPTMLGSLLAALGAVAASIVCSVVYSLAVSKPIRSLAAQMEKITLDDCDGIMVEDRTDEIGILQNSFNYMIVRNKELITQQYQMQLEKRNAQLHALQAQINPHFMYNTLQVIGGMALGKNAPEVYNVTVALSDIMRYSLNFSKEMVPLAEEIEYLKSYVMIQNERFGRKIHMELSLTPDALRCLIPKLILQPLVENSFEHGLLNKSGEWRIIVEGGITQEGDLLLSVKDNGLGFQKEQLDEIQARIENNTADTLTAGAHIGLGNVHARIRLRWPEKRYGVRICSDQDAGTSVSVCMQTVYEEE